MRHLDDDTNGLWPWEGPTAGDEAASTKAHPPMPPDLPLAVLSSFLLWFDLYAFLCILYPHCSYEWNGQAVTAIHALVSSSLCIVSIFIIGPSPFYYIGRENTPLHSLIVLVSLGYFIFDSVKCICMYTWTDRAVILMLAHHSVSTFGLCYVTYCGRYGSDVTALLGGSELTTPLMQLRWFWKRTGHYVGKKAFLLDWCFATVFLTVRVGVGSVFLVMFLVNPNVDSLVMIILVTDLYLISLIFSVHIICFLKRKYLHRIKSNNNHR